MVGHFVRDKPDHSALIAAMAHVFAYFESHYGAIWTMGKDQRALQQKVTSWMTALQKGGYTASEVNRALRRIDFDKRFEDYPPHLRQFKQLCWPTPQDLGLPDASLAYQIVTQQLLHQASGSPFLRAAKTKTGAGLLESRAPYAVKLEFVRHYEELVSIYYLGKTDETMERLLEADRRQNPQPAQKAAINENPSTEKASPPPRESPADVKQLIKSLKY